MNRIVGGGWKLIIEQPPAQCTYMLRCERKKKTGIVRVTFQGLVLPDQCMSGIADEAVISKGGCKFTILPQGSGHADKGVVSCPV